jgi:hypothetical protein
MDVLPETKLPVPDETHEPVAELPLMVPLIMAEALDEHKVWEGEAITVAWRAICTDMVPLAGVQAPFLVDVNVKITEPVLISAGAIE